MAGTDGRGRVGRWSALVVAALAVSACGGGDDIGGRDRVIVDPGGELDAAARRSIERAAVPDEHALVVAVVDFDRSLPIGPQADAVLDPLSEACESEARCDKKGIYVLLDSARGFPQLRVGSRLELSSMFEGATYGPEYVAAQQLAAGQAPSAQAATFVPYAIDAVLAAESRASWFERWGDRAASSGYGDFAADFVADSFPDGGYYEHFLVSPFLELQALERRHVGTWFLSLALSVALFLLVGRAVLAFTRRFASAWVRWPGLVVFVVANLAAAIVSLPITASLILQSGARLEDAADVQRAFGELPPLRFWAEAWAPAQNVWLSIAVGVVGLVRGSAGLVEMAGVAGLVSTKGRDALRSAGRLGEWQEEVSDLATDDRFLFRHLVVPVLVAVAGFQILPAALTVAVLMGWLVEASIKVVETVDTVRYARALDRLVDGVPTDRPEPTSVLIRVVLGGAGVAAAAMIGVVASRSTAWEPVSASPPPVVAAAATTTTAVIPPFAPEAGQWSLMPLVAKSLAAEGSQGDEVRYLQGVLRQAGMAVEITGVFDAATTEAVRGLQTFMSLEPTGVVDDVLWTVIDEMSKGSGG